jgi:hypothetical protein
MIQEYIVYIFDTTSIFGMKWNLAIHVRKFKLIKYFPSIMISLGTLCNFCMGILSLFNTWLQLCLKEFSWENNLRRIYVYIKSTCTFLFLGCTPEIDWNSQFKWRSSLSGLRPSCQTQEHICCPRMLGWEISR